jgi:hypothetical protein
MKNVVMESGKPMIYVGSETLFFRPAYPSFSGVIFIVEDGPRIIVRNPENLSLQISDLPSAVVQKINTGIMVTGLVNKVVT